VSVSTNLDPDLVAGGESLPPTPGASRRVSAAEGYECWAPIYDRVRNPLLALEERHLSPLLTNLRNKSVLDLACGTGRWLERFMTQGCASGVGIDCSIAMLRVAGTKNAIRGHLTRADCENLPLPSAAFDLAICSFAVGHIQNLGCMARELGRVTKTRADVFVSDLHPGAYGRGWRVGFRDGNTAIQIEMRSRAAEEIVQEFGVNGFECLALESLWLGEPERPIFTRAGKSDSFVEACKIPAVLVCHFRRVESPDRRGAA
jgi:SAM-dependent methyltransferase